MLKSHISTSTQSILPVLCVVIVAACTGDASLITSPTADPAVPGVGAHHGAPDAAATIINGGFESGDFTGWNQTGNNNADLASYSVITNLGSVVPTEGIQMAMVQGAANTDFNFLWSDPFDWLNYAEVCFDARVVFNGTPSSGPQPLEAIAKEPTNGQPILADIVIESTTYSTTNYISGEQNSGIALLAGGDTGFDSMTEWETFCIDPLQVNFVDGSVTELSFFMPFGWSGTDFTDQAYLFDNLRGVCDDTATPTMSLEVTPSSLWPPNHKYVEIGVTAALEGDCNEGAAAEVWVQSSEPDDAKGNGDGHTTGDIRVTLVDGTVLTSSNESPSVRFPYADLETLELRAERAGKGSGRTYTIVVAVTDANGSEVGSETATVSVPHNGG